MSILEELRDELEAIRRMATLALEKLAKLGAGFKPARDVGRPQPRDTWAVVQRVRDALPEDLLPKLTVVDQGDGVVTITSEWLGSPDWNRLNNKVKQMGGRWIRAGKDSR